MMNFQQQHVPVSVLPAPHAATRPADAAPRAPAEAGHPPGDLWVVVLAGGEGLRLASITTTPDGLAVPKQYCSVDGRRTLLRTTLERAERLATTSRVVAVVAPHHERWWRRDLERLPAGNILVQPAARGTAAGVLLPVLTILRRDPRAMVVVLPSDHHVADEETLHRELLAAVHSSLGHGGRPVLLGIEPQLADAGYGWIVPARSGAERCTPIASFVEKPAPDRAAELKRQGALWSSFMFAASATALVRLYERALPGLLRDFDFAMGWGERHHRPDWLRDLYATLACHDFSRDVLEAVADETRVLGVPPCGWSDLGTPERLAATPGLRGPLVNRARALIHGAKATAVAAEKAAAGAESRSAPAGAGAATAAAAVLPAELRTFGLPSRRARVPMSASAPRQEQPALCRSPD